MDTTTAAKLFFLVLLPLGITLIFIIYTESEEAASKKYERESAIRAYIADMDSRGPIYQEEIPRRDCPSCGAPWAPACPYCQRGA